MVGLRVRVAALLPALAVIVCSHAARAAGDVDAAFRAFWDASSADAAVRTITRIIDSGADFDTAWGRLKAGRPYVKEKTGLIRMPTTVGGAVVENLIEIPADYDPAKKWELRVQLHGGVGRELPAPGAPAAQPQSTR